ncbi:MAG: TetR family transcriptional regulator [Pseudomonadota bacterium]
MDDLRVESKRGTILRAAAAAFREFGVRKTSMEDIATRAGMSRSALYMHYRNKTDIQTSLRQMQSEALVSSVRCALESEGSLAKRLSRAFLAQAGLKPARTGVGKTGAWRGGLDDPVAAPDRQVLSAVYADWLAAEASKGRVALSKSPDHIAETVLDALDGLIRGAADPVDLKARLETLALLIGHGVSARDGPD